MLYHQTSGIPRDLNVLYYIKQCQDYDQTYNSIIRSLITVYSCIIDFNHVHVSLSKADDTLVAKYCVVFILERPIIDI